MKKLIFSLKALVFSTLAMAQIPNSGFETWSNAGGFNTPESWDNPNSMTASANVYTCTKGTPGSPGTAYLKLVSKNVAGMGVVPGLAVSGTLDMATLKPKTGFAYDARPGALAGKWQYMASGNDQGFVAIYLTKWDSGMGMRDTIGKAVKLLPGMAMSWATFSIPIVYSSESFPDSCEIVLSASGSVPVATSYLYVDNLSFTGVVTSNKPIENKAEVRIWPSPATDFLNLELGQFAGQVEKVRILDMSGRVIQEYGGSMDGQKSFYVGELPKGSYLLELQTEDKKVLKQFLK